jgi:hypothetical protein
MGPARFDAVAAVASALALTMTFVYLSVMRQQDSEPAGWVVATLLLGAVAAGYGALTTARHRRTALVVAGGLLGMLGLLAILTIGLPILLAAALCLVSLVRRGPVPTA